MLATRHRPAHPQPDRRLLRRDRGRVARLRRRPGGAPGTARFAPGFALPELTDDVRRVLRRRHRDLAGAGGARRAPAADARPDRQPGHPHHEDLRRRC